MFRERKDFIRDAVAVALLLLSGAIFILGLAVITVLLDGGSCW